MNTYPFTVRRETVCDLEPIQSVHQGAFPGPAEACLVDLLRRRGKASITLVAESGGMVVGHILFSPVTIRGESGETKGYGIAPLAVLPGYQRQGIGSELIRQGLSLAREAGVDYIVVLGDPGYYQRFGFRAASTYDLANEYGADREFMVLELHPGALADVRGLVQYAPEFRELEV